MNPAPDVMYRECHYLSVGDIKDCVAGLVIDSGDVDIPDVRWSYLPLAQKKRLDALEPIKNKSRP
jgi:hypothetical protein